MGYVLKWCNALLGNEYILALFLFAIIIEILLLPFGIKQQKNSIRQARLKPKELAIRKKYAGRDDKQTQQMLSQEISEMYQKENYSPMAGCLPMLIQLPIIIALYNIVLNPLRYICGLSESTIDQLLTVVKSFPEYADQLANATSSRTIELLGAMKNLMTKYGSDVFSTVEGFSDSISGVDALPNLTLFGGAIDLGMIPSFSNPGWILLVPLLTFVVYFVSMKITRKLTFQPSMGANDQAMGCSNKMMDFTMPLMSVFISFGVPAAVGVYWIFKSIVSTIKQFILHKAMPLPTFTEEDYKEAEREVGVRSKTNKEKRAERSKGSENNAPVKKSEKVGSVRSLHHIDDEDFEDTRERAERAKAAIAAAEAEKAALKQSKDEKISLDADGAMLKTDDAVRPEGKKRAKKGDKSASLQKDSEEKSPAEGMESAPSETEMPAEETGENTNNN